MKRFSKITLSVASFLLASTASAATLYVAPTGSDSAAGSLTAPFRTITQAARVAAAGDTVNVRAGVYNDAVTISSKGTAAAPIVFRAMAGEKVVLDGTSIAAGKPVVSLNGTEFVDFDGFEVRNSAYIGIVLWHAKNTRVLNNDVHHTTRNGIYVGGDVMAACSDITVSGNSVHDTVLENQYHAMTSGGWAGAIVVSRTERANIVGNRVFNNDGEGIISLRSNHASIRQNEIFDNYSVYLYLDNARFATVDRNLIYSTGNTRYFRDGRPGTGIGIANETKDVMNPSSDNTITNNIVIGTRWGFYYGNYESGGGLKNTRVLNNTFHGTTDEIIRIDNDAHANSVVANNIFSQTGSPTPRYAGAGAVQLRNNLWYGGAAGAAAGAGDVIGDPRFTNPGGFRADDYRVKDLSPAIHTAADLGEVTTDFFGAARTPTYDIGAHEQSLSLGSSAPVMGSEPSGPAPTPAPAAPGDLTGGAIDASTIELMWVGGSADTTGFMIYRNGQHVATTTATLYRDQALQAETAYTYHVVAINAAGKSSAKSNAVTITSGKKLSNRRRSA